MKPPSSSVLGVRIGLQKFNSVPPFSIGDFMGVLFTRNVRSITRIT